MRFQRKFSLGSPMLPVAVIFIFGLGLILFSCWPQNSSLLKIGILISLGVAVFCSFWFLASLYWLSFKTPTISQISSVRKEHQKEDSILSSPTDFEI